MNYLKIISEGDDDFDSKVTHVGRIRLCCNPKEFQEKFMWLAVGVECTPYGIPLVLCFVSCTRIILFTWKKLTNTGSFIRTLTHSKN